VNANRLAVALRALGVECDVEAREKLAVIIPSAGGATFADEATRLRVVRLAREHGFTHVAVELIGESAGAPVLRD